LGIINLGYVYLLRGLWSISSTEPTSSDFCWVTTYVQNSAFELDLRTVLWISYILISGIRKEFRLWSIYNLYLLNILSLCDFACLATNDCFCKYCSSRLRKKILIFVTRPYLLFYVGRQTGWPDDLVNFRPNHFGPFLRFLWKSSPKFGQLVKLQKNCFKFSICSVGGENSPNLRSMLWSQFFAVFANFRLKYWRFSQKPMLWSNFYKKAIVVWAKNANIVA
jgi:hypothetical protein